ncbi:MAG: tetratricopeptide repeat protein [Caldilineaceae bacterium]|nr:tetratricopeptide repeat protein [Caldilineaceae bacterium]
MYLDRSYKPRRRRGRWRWWPIFLLAAIAIFLYEQRPAWLLEPSLEPTPVPTRSGASFQAEAENYLAAGDFQSAMTAYRRMAQLEPTDPAPLTALSQLNLMLQDIPASYADAQDAVARGPDDPDALAALARVEDWRGEYEAAINHALDALEIDPEHVDALAVLAEIYADVGNWQIAQDYLDQAFALDQNSVLTWRNQAYLYERQGEYEEAVAAYAQAISLAPLRYDLYIEQGRQYRVGLAEFEKANDSYRRAVEVYESPVTLDALGFGLYNIGDHLQAIRTLRDAVEMDPDYGPAQVHLGMALYARRNYEDTVPALERGIELLGDDARVEHYYTLGLAYIFKDPPDCGQAEPWLRKALELEPESGPALEGLAICARQE